MVRGADGVPSRTPDGGDGVVVQKEDTKEVGKLCRLVNEYTKQGIRTLDRNYWTIWGWCN